MTEPEITVVVPTRDRPGYLEVTLASVARQETSTPHEILVVDDGAGGAGAAILLMPSLYPEFERVGKNVLLHGEVAIGGEGGDG